MIRDLAEFPGGGGYDGDNDDADRAPTNGGSNKAVIQVFCADATRNGDAGVQDEDKDWLTLDRNNYDTSFTYDHPAGAGGCTGATAHAFNGTTDGEEADQLQDDIVNSNGWYTIEFDVDDYVIDWGAWADHDLWVTTYTMGADIQPGDVITFDYDGHIATFTGTCKTSGSEVDLSWSGTAWNGTPLVWGANHTDNDQKWNTLPVDSSSIKNEDHRYEPTAWHRNKDFSE